MNLILNIYCYDINYCNLIIQKFLHFRKSEEFMKYPILLGYTYNED